jgi:hypothetical protein
VDDDPCGRDSDMLLLLLLGDEAAPFGTENTTIINGRIME